MPDYDASIRVGTEVNTSQMQKLQIQIDKTASKVESLANKLDEVRNKKAPTEEYIEISKQIEKAEARLISLNAKQERMISLGKTSGSTWDGIKYDIEEVKNELLFAKSDLQDLVDTGKAFTVGGNSDEIAEYTSKLSMAKSELFALNTRKQELIDKQNDVASGFNKLSQSASKCYKTIQSGAKKANGLFSTMKSRLKGIALSLLVFNWITKGFNAMVSAMKEGFKNLAQYSSDYNKSMSELRSQTAQLKNGLAAAFEPIVNTVIPYLTQMVSWMNRAVDSISQFMAALQGKSTYTKAKEQVIDYAKSLDTASKSAKGALASFDDLNLWNKNESGSAGGEATGASAFETGTVEADMISLADRVQEILQPFKDSIANWFQGLDFSPLLDALGNLKSACEPFISYIYNGMLWLLENILEPLGSWTMEDALPNFISMLSDGMKTLNNVLETLRPTFDYIWQNILVPIGNYTGEVFLWAIDLIKDAFSSMSQLFSEKGDKINEILTTIGRAIELLWKCVAKPTIDLMRGALKTFLRYVVNIVGDLIDAFSGIIDFLTGVFTGNWKKAWNGLVDVFKGIINLFIDIFEGVVNTIIDGLNFISIDVPDWVPGISGKHFGFDLERISLPKLADGAVIQGGRPFTAILGDQRFGQTNIETPLPTMVDAFKQAISDMGGLNNGYNGPLYLQIDGKTFAKLELPYLNGEQNRIGVSFSVT